MRICGERGVGGGSRAQPRVHHDLRLSDMRLRSLCEWEIDNKTQRFQLMKCTQAPMRHSLETLDTSRGRLFVTSFIDLVNDLVEIISTLDKMRALISN